MTAAMPESMACSCFPIKARFPEGLDGILVVALTQSIRLLALYLENLTASSNQRDQLLLNLAARFRQVDLDLLSKQGDHLGVN